MYRVNIFGFPITELALEKVSLTKSVCLKYSNTFFARDFVGWISFGWRRPLISEAKTAIETRSHKYLAVQCISHLN